MFLINFLHTFEPDRLAFTIASLPIYWYGLGYALALGLALVLGQRLVEPVLRSTWERVWWWAAIGGLIGARLYVVLILEPLFFWQHPSEIIAIWHGGMAIHGGIIGGILGIFYGTHRLKLETRNSKPETKSELQVTSYKLHNINYWLDLASPLVAFGQAIGRWGNYFNQELYGRATSLPWGIPISGQPDYYHPTFLYESLLNLVLAALLWKLFLHSQRREWPAGLVVATYLIGYGLIRFGMEFLRVDQTAMLGTLRLPQLMSVILVMAGVIIFKTRLPRSPMAASQ